MERMFEGESHSVPDAAAPGRDGVIHVGWKEGTIEHPKQPPGGRDLARYAEMFSIKPETLQGKRVLDLGSGPEAKLDRQLREQGITDRVISLSPDYVVQGTRDKLLATNQAAKPVAGLGQALPFQDESFDAVFSLHTFEHVSHDTFESMIKESARILRGGGEAHLGPIIADDDYDPCALVNQNLVLQDYLRQQGVEAEFQAIDEHVMPPTKTVHGGRIGATQLILRKKL
jgi:cyclopropane fatty-acyl-phospholipid synthase-like methyltransferase